jgi:beta-lactamase regulating signal transducer with metallopeptidase domain
MLHYHPAAALSAGSVKDIALDQTAIQDIVYSFRASGPVSRLDSISSLFGSYFQPHLPLLVTLWLLGILVLFLRYMGQMAYLQRLKSYGVQPFAQHWNQVIHRLESRLHISSKVRYLESLRVSSPITLGWLRPVILFPIGLAARLTPQEVEFILLHELAHIKRNDYLVNVLQSLVSILLFYHPAAWWLSGQLSREREQCCDDLVVLHSGQPDQYAATLINLQEQYLKLHSPALAFSGTKSGFSTRILRLINGPSSAANRFREGFLTALVVVTGLGLLGATGYKSDPGSMSVSRVRAEEKGAPKTGNSPLPGSGTPLIVACQQGDVHTAKLLLAGGADVNQFSPGDGNPLIMAAAHGHMPLVVLLIEHGADVNAVVEGDETPLINAAGSGHLEIVKYLVEKGADVNLSVLANPDTRPELRSPLGQAIKNRRADVEAYLREKGGKR